MFESKFKALDLFCCEGGAGMGLHQAGFDVTGIDHRPQKRYPFKFIQADALAFDVSGFDFIWASPPCQLFSSLNRYHKDEHPNLIEPIRQKLRSAGVPYIIENVIGAPLINPIMLCGLQFGLKVYRHRIFESNYLLFAPTHYPHDDQTPSVGRGVSKKGFISVTGNGGFGIPHGLDYAKRAMGIDWMSRKGLSQAIPPAYSKFLGQQIMNALQNIYECAA